MVQTRQPELQNPLSPTEYRLQEGFYPEILQSCRLCQMPNLAPLAGSGDLRDYTRCPRCDLHFLSPTRHLSAAEEMARYLLHENDPTDFRYQKFVQPLCDEILARATIGQMGLDFGAGTGPVLAEMLEHRQLQIKKYDPFFWRDDSLLSQAYDFVYCCEVIEHFYDPSKEFRRLRQLLRPGGFLAVMTHFWEPSVDFESWYYRRDPTHVAFYSEATANWIQRELGFSRVTFLGSRIAIFETAVADRAGLGPLR